MEQRTLGKSDLRVSAIGLGLMSMSGTYGKSDDEQSIRVIHAALDRGVNFLDSSDLYGWGTTRSSSSAPSMGGARVWSSPPSSVMSRLPTARGPSWTGGRPTSPRRVTRASSVSASM